MYTYTNPLPRLTHTEQEYALQDDHDYVHT